MNAWKRSGAGVLGAVVLLATGGCASDSNRAEGKEGGGASRPAQGGKVRAPIDVTSSVEGEVPSGVPFSVTLAVTPHEACQSLTTRVRGLDGVVVEGEAVSHGPCVAGTPVTQGARVRVPDGTAGYLVLDVSLERLDGRRITDARSFELHRSEATQSKRTPGNLTYDAQGRPIQVMPAESR